MKDDQIFSDLLTYLAISSMKTDNLLILYELVGEDMFKKIIRVFDGTQLYIPGLESFEKKIRNIQIWRCLKPLRANSNAYKAAIKVLKEKHGLTTSDIKGIYKQVDETMKKIYGGI